MPARQREKKEERGQLHQITKISKIQKLILNKFNQKVIPTNKFKIMSMMNKTYNFKQGKISLLKDLSLNGIK